MVNYDFKEMNVDFIQLKPPAAGDRIAIIDTDYGEIRVVLYEKYAPNAVHNFIKNAEEGMYDDIPVKGIGTDMYFLTGGWEDKRGNYVGRNTDEELIEDEYCVDLWPFTGALMGFSEMAGYNDARWFIVFYEVGGVFGLAGENTVYGQTYLGLDVVKKLTQIPADKEGMATETVKIKSVTISEFKEGDKTDKYPREPLHPKEEDSGTSSDNGDSKGTE